MMTIGMTAARSQLRELAAKARHGHERIQLTDNGRLAAVLISPEDAAEFERLEGEDIEREIAEARRIQGEDISAMTEQEFDAFFGDGPEGGP